MELFASVLAGGLGGLVAAAAAVMGIALTQRSEDMRLVLADRQHLRDAKAERLRRLYEPLLSFAMVLDGVVKQKGYGMEGETVSQRDARHERQMTAQMAKVSEVVPGVMMEPETDAVVDAYNGAFHACDAYLRMWRMQTAGHAQFRDRSHQTTGRSEQNGHCTQRRYQRAASPFGDSARDP